MKRTRLYWQSILIVAFAAVGTLFAAQTGDALKIPGEFKHWYLVHSTLITKDEQQVWSVPRRSSHLRECDWVRPFEARRIDSLPGRHHVH